MPVTTRSQNKPLTSPGSDTLLSARHKIFHARATVEDSHQAATIQSNPYVQQAPVIAPTNPKINVLDVDDNIHPDALYGDIDENVDIYNKPHINVLDVDDNIHPNNTAPYYGDIDDNIDIYFNNHLFPKLTNWLINSINPNALLGASAVATATAAIQATTTTATPLLITAAPTATTTGALSLIGGGAAATIGTGTLLLSGAGILAAAAVGGYCAYNYLWGDDNSKALQTTNNNQPTLEAEARKIAIQERKTQFKVKKAAAEARQLREARRKEVLELREERAKLNANYAQSARQARKLRKARKQEVRAMKAKFKLAKSTTPAVSPSLVAALQMTESTYRETFKNAIEAREAMEAKRKAEQARLKAEAEKARLAEVARLAAEAEKTRLAAEAKQAQLPRCNATLLIGNIKCSMS